MYGAILYGEKHTLKNKKYLDTMYYLCNTAFTRSPGEQPKPATGLAGKHKEIKMQNTPKALAQYRALDKSGKIDYDPSGKHGADRVRELQKIAQHILAVRLEIEDIARNIGNPQFPEWRKSNSSLRGLFRAAGYEVPALVREAQRMHTIPLGAQDAAIATRAARAAHPRRSNWDSPRPYLNPCASGDTLDEAFAYKGKYKGRTGYTYHPTMQSAARISNDGAILTALIGYTGKVAVCTVQAGRGYQWGTDANGVRLVRLADGADYHPSSDEIRSGRTAIIATLRERADTRKKATAAAKRDAQIIARACKDGVWVCLADAIAAGNCRTGTESFARRHGLDISRHYRAEVLPREQGDTSRRVALAVLAAQRRQARDLERGYAEI